ncbi:phage tail spike protein [Aeribacillus sp. FSL K6-1121]|uniref:phage tail spike protein n=1 Tax=Aeribacillus sp. FSL K6-1121 TaxID=2954745 RepID=UPI0030FC501E
MIHIADSQTDKILGFIPEDEFWDDVHKKSLKDTLETFDFTTFADREYAEHLAKRNRIIIPDEDGRYIEFVIENTRKYRDTDGSLLMEVYSVSSYLELAKAKTIEPQTLSDQTPNMALGFALEGTGWLPGRIEGSGTRTFHIDQYTNPYSFTKTIATEYKLERNFRVEHDGNKITGRFLDLVERVGMWRGREVEFGKDLIGIERKEDFSNIVTALIGLGPEREDGTRLEVFVEDKDALARWGRNGQHLVEVYEPESTDQTMTEERLRELTQNELEKRVNSVVEYTADIADLEKVPGLEHEKIRFGDTIRIKDTAFIPPLYLEARVHTMERSIKKNGYKTVTLGDYIEYTEEEVMAIWKSLKAEIAKKVSMSDVTEVVYTKPEVDSKDAGVYQDSTQYSDVISETKKQEAIQVAAEDATNKAQQAEDNAKSHANSIAEQKKQEAINAAIADADAKLSAAKTELEADIALKVDAEWVNGQLVTKADKANTYTKTEVDNALNSKVSVTQYTTDMNGVITRLDSAESRITQNENEIATKVSNTTYQQDKTTINNNISQLQTKMSNAETSISQLSSQIALKANAMDVYTKSQIDGQFSTVNQQITNLSAQLTVQADQIATKVSRTEFESLQIGGRNLLRNTDFRNGLNNWSNWGTATREVVDLNGKKWVHLSQNDSNRWRGVSQVVLSIKPSTPYTVSFIAYSQNNSVMTVGFHQRLGNTIVTQNWQTFTLTNSPKKYSYTFTTTGSSIDQFNFMIGNDQSPFDIYITDIKLEIGNKATDWTPAPEDVQGQIDGLGTRVSSAETSITQLANQISLKANQTTVDTLANRISSAESTLTIHTNQIATKVSQTDFNGNTIASLINQTATTIKLLAERIEFAGHVFGEDATFSGNIEVRKTVNNQVFDNMFNGDEFRFVKFKKGITNPNTKNIDLSQVENMAKIFYDGVAFANSSQSMGLGLSGITHSGLLNVYANRIAMSAVSSVNITSPVSIWGNTDVWGSLTADKLKSNADIEFGANGRLTNEGADITYIQGNGQVRATRYKSGTLVPMYAASFNTSSSVDTKTNIEKWEESALEILRNEAELYSYNKIDELNDGINRKRHGFVIGGEYKVPAQLLSLDGKAIDGYEHSVLNTKAIMELDDEQQLIKDDVEWLKIENQYLKQKVSLLESRIQELEAKMA